MTAPVKNQREATDVVLVQDTAVGILPLEIQHQLELRKLTNQVAGQLASMSWGQKLDLATRRAIADWGRQYRVDVATEIHVLGGNIYLNATWYLRRLSEMIAAGAVEYAYADHVEDDPRLAKLGADGEGEASRRLRERIKYQVPDKAASAVVFRVKVRGMEREVVGVKWCGNGTRTNDPVGDAKPVETSETRAARRAMRLLATHVPPELLDDVTDVERIEVSAESLSGRVGAAKARIAEQEEAARLTPRPLAASTNGDPYSRDTSLPEQPKEAVRVDGRSASPDVLSTAREAARQPDPYRDADQMALDDDRFDDTDT